jgi:pyruvate, orthophosphate dikinase
LTSYPEIQRLEAGADVPAHTYGARAAKLVTLMNQNLPVPPAFALSVQTVQGIALGQNPDLTPFLEGFAADTLFSVRSSAVQRAWGGAETLLNVGMNDVVHKRLCRPLGRQAMDAVYCRFVHDYAVKVVRLDAEDFESLGLSDARPDYGQVLARFLARYQVEMDAPFPQSPEVQLRKVLQSMAKAWAGTTARILRAARGAPIDAGMGLIVQSMALGLGKGECGSGEAQSVSPITGAPKITGRYLRQSQGRDAVEGARPAQYLSLDARGPSLEEACPAAFAALNKYAAAVRIGCRDEMKLDFTIVDGTVQVLDAKPAERSARAAVAIAVSLAEDGILSRKDALMRIAPRSLTEILHPQVGPNVVRSVFASGIAASPGAASGKIVFSAAAAQASAAREEPCILVRTETKPEDIRGMHSAKGVLTERGGTTSHAAVIARGLGLPCIVGASDIDVNRKDKTLTLRDGGVLREGDEITVDGSNGEALLGAVKLVQPNIGGDLDTFMGWADDVRDIGVRANADTPQDAQMSRVFKADGIGLCRTEHMFFEPGRLTVMREMIFTDSEPDRRAALNLLLPMQRSDFVELFQIMQGLPVCIRLLDPPLHEFLPKSRDEMQAMAEAMDIPVSQVMSRVEDLSEFNPMLGMRGVRLGITVPEIYDMQARAIFEATAEVNREGNITVVPEIMIPLVSANREVELVKTRVDAVAAAVQLETGAPLEYALGVMVETPRAALRASDMARSSSFLSFGTNDLTQMTYGLSRDDAGRFMSDYVQQGVFPEDPFHTLDVEGVGELLLMAAERGRAQSPGLILGLCGEHGGDPASVAFCRTAGFDYVSCSPFRTPIARLAAAQAAISDPNGPQQDPDKTTTLV